MLARIFTRQHDGLRELSEKLEAAGYEVEVWAPDQTPSTPADLDLRLETMSVEAALQTAQRAASEAGADIFVAPGAIEGLLPAPEEAPPLLEHQIDSHRAEAFPWDECPQLEARVAGEPSFPPAHLAPDEQPEGDRESVISGYPGRISGALAAWQQRRAAAAEERRQREAEREREREQQRQAEQLALQRRWEEEQRAEAERRRLAAEEMARQRERERVAREEMARQAALAAERERAAREQTARLAALRAEQERVAREEMERQAALVAQREREARQRREHDAAIGPDRQLQDRIPAVPNALQPPLRPQPSASAFSPLPAVVPQPRTEIYASRRISSMRERRWQQAAFFASVATMAVMLGFGAAMNIGKRSPIPSNLLQNGVQQQTPFGPATLAANPATPTQPAKTSRAAASKPRPQPPRPAAPKPSPQVRSGRRAASRDSSADDEVIVRHYTPARTNTAQTRNDGVKRFSDQDK